MVLSDKEKLDFVNTTVSWIEGRYMMDSCFTLNYGYDAPLPWPQVNSRVQYIYAVAKTHYSLLTTNFWSFDDI